MKKNYFLYVAVFLSSFCTAQTYGPNLVVNGDFESSGWTSGQVPPSWTVTSGANATGYNIEPVAGYNGISGTQSLREGSGYMSIYQDITVEAGASYHFGFTSRSSDAAGPSGSTLTGTNNVTMEIRNVIGGAPQSPALKYFVNTGNTNVSGTSDFTATTNTTIRVTVYKSAKIVYIDDVFVSKNLSTAVLNVSEGNIQVAKTGNKTIQVSGDNIHSITVLSLAGKQLYTQSTNSATTTVNLDRFPSGVYIVQTTLINGSKIVSKQII